MDKPTSLYVHIPFCSSICGYCDFCKLISNPSFEEKYVPALIHEVGSFSLSGLKTIYVGGGTPTALSDAHFKEVLSCLSRLKGDEYEFTVEANPESLSDAKLAIMKETGVNRLSIGLESSHKKYLDLMGRHHGYKDVVDAVKRAKAIGIDNINVDLIYALPGESDEELIEDINALLALDVDHISAYSLILEDSSIFNVKGLKEADEDVQAHQYEIVLAKLREAGYERYEVSNFARKQRYSRHNLVYWKDEGYYAAGLGASGYVDDIRFQNTKNLNKYLSGDIVAEKEYVEPKSGSDKEYFFITNLRLSTGFLKEEYKKRFEKEFEEEYKEQLEKLISQGLLMADSTSIKPTDKGILLLDTILRELI